MGDYTKKGEKIGTCGNAYYATKEMIEIEYLNGDNSPDIQYYLDEKQSISFAFPFPQYDKKKIGEISNFHEGERIDFYFNFKGHTLHNEIAHHMHPNGGAGVNVFRECPQSGKGHVSSNLDITEGVTFRLVSQYNNKTTGKLSIGAECIYCGCVNVFDAKEADQVCINILNESENYLLQSKNTFHSESERKRYAEKYEYYNKIALRIAETYN